MNQKEFEVSEEWALPCVLEAASYCRESGDRGDRHLPIPSKTQPAGSGRRRKTASRGDIPIDARRRRRRRGRGAGFDASCGMGLPAARRCARRVQSRHQNLFRDRRHAHAA